MFRLLLSLAVATTLCFAAAAGRVFLVSLDGLGYEAFHEDPAGRELTAVHKLAAEGVEARGMTPHFPSTTANGHAAIWTGMWGDSNGIASNSLPALPRADHTFLDRINGYRSDALRSQPLWVTAAQQGVRTVGQQVTQAYPFTKLNTAPGAVVLNGYQTRLLAEHMLLRRADVKPEACQKASPRDAQCYTWTAGPVKLHGTLMRGGQPRFVIRAESGKSAVEAAAAPLETDPPRSRGLARHFSTGLHLARVADAGPATLYFRLFEVTASDFLLYQSPIHELGVYPAGDLRDRLIREAGGFIGNGLKAVKALGTPLHKGGDGTAERRQLEIVELVVKQFISHAEWLVRNVDPRLFIGYIPYPDEVEHSWKGLARQHPQYDAFRIWGYAAANRYVAAVSALQRPEDRIVLVSDHGMAPVFKEVRVNAAFQQAGLLSATAKGAVDPSRTRVMDIRNCLLVNTTDWKDGLVPPKDKARVIQQAAGVLERLRDPETGKRVITRIYTSPADAARFGYGGSSGADACFDYAPGYGGSDVLGTELIVKRDPATGAHGFAPTRADMEAVFLAAGAGIKPESRMPKLRAIDVAPFVLKSLGLKPAAP